ncbi:MAG: hypothetical protein ABIE70_09320 [bacterium]
MKCVLCLSILVMFVLALSPGTARGDTTLVWQVFSNGATVTDNGDTTLIGTLKQTAIRRCYYDTLCLQQGFWPWFSPTCACCVGIRGNVDADPEDLITIADLVYLVNFMFNGGPAPACMEEADVDGNGDGPDIADLIYLNSYMFGDPQGPAPAACP